MKTKPLFLTVLILAIVAALGYWLTSRDSSPYPDAARSGGDPLFEPGLISEISQIQLTDSDNEVLLEKTDEIWRLPGFFNLPVDFEKLKRLTDNLLDAKIDRFVTSNPESLSRLELGQTKILLTTETGKNHQLQIGKSGQNGGSFIQIDEENTAYLTRASLSVDARHSNWPQKQPMQLKEEEISKFEIELPDEKLVFFREEKSGSFTGENLSENEEADSRAISSLIRTLLNARFTQAVDPDDPDAKDARARAISINLEDFDGSKYGLEIGRRPGTPTEQKTAKTEKPKENQIETEPASASVVFDSDGNVISPEEIERLRSESTSETDSENNSSSKPETTPETEAAEEIEPVDPGPLFIFYSSDNPDFLWGDLMKNVALQFGDHLFDRLPADRSDLIKTIEQEESEKQ